MAVPAGPTEQRYVGNGVTTIFTVPFLVIQPSDLAVYVDGVKLTSGYTQSGAGNPTSTVTFTVAPAVGAQILLTLEVPFERLNDYQENGDFLAPTVNNDYDRIWQALKQLLRYAGRALTLGQFDVDGQGWYRAKGNGIRDLNDPVLDQDAATKKWSEDFISSILETGQGPINNAANVVLVGANGYIGAVQDVANKNNFQRGAAMLGFIRSPLDVAIGTVGRMLASQTVNIWEFASYVTNKPDPLDPGTWIWTPAIQAMVSSGAGAGYFPEIPGNTYKTDAPVNVDNPIKLIGPKAKRLGENVGVCIDNIGTGDTIVYSNTKAIYDAGIERLALYSTTGHALNLKYGTTRCHYLQNYLYTRATNRADVAMLYTSGTAGVDFVGSYSNVFEGGEFIVDKVARTAANIDMLATGTFINENQFRNLWVSNAKGRPAIRLMATTAGQLLSSNRFDGVIAEYCEGGVILLQATDRTVINNLSAWDQPAGYAGTLIAISNDGSVMANRGLSIRNYARKGSDPLLGGVFDIDLGNSIDTTLENDTTLTGAVPVIECRNRSLVLVGGTNATLNNAGAVSQMRGAGLISPEFATRTGNRFHDSGAAAEVQAPAGVVRISSTVSGNTRALIVSGSTALGGSGAIAPDADAVMNIGDPSLRIKTMYSQNAVVVGSDRRYKEGIKPIDDAVLRAWEKVQPVQFKMTDTADEREFFGYIAQDIVDAFASEGLDAVSYGIVEHHEWDEISGDDGEVVTRIDRYGVRYEQALVLSSALLLKKMM